MMFKKITALFSLIILINSCGNQIEKKEDSLKNDSAKIVLGSDCKLLYAEARRLDSVLQKINSVDYELAEIAMNAFNNYSSACPSDSLAPLFLLKAGQVAQSVGKFQQSEIFYKKCSDDFPLFRNRGVALFLLAQLYDDAIKLNNESKAEEIYKQIIKDYPNSPWERDSKACLKSLGKTDEQLIQEFLKQTNK